MEDFFSAKITDLDRIAHDRDITKNTGFLSAGELADFYALEPSLTAPHFVFGGSSECERAMVIWPASYEVEETLKEELIACIRCVPVNRRFSDDLSHRDFLGALMNLSLERERIGDIFLEKSADSGCRAFLFCDKKLAPLIAEELTRVRHTDIRCDCVPLSACDLKPELEEMRINIPSERLDAVIAAVYRLPRTKASELCAEEKVFIDGRSAKSRSGKIPDGAKISVRGLGKFIYRGTEAESRKGRLFVRIEKYV